MKNSEISIDIVGDTLKIDTDQSIGSNVTIDAKDQVDEIVQKNSEKFYSKSLEEKFKHDIEELRNNLFTLFSILASVIAFLFAEIQILNHACSKGMMIGLSLIFLGGLSFFVLLIKFILSFKEDFDGKKDINIKSPICIIGLIALGSIVVGIIFASGGDELRCRTETIIQQYEEKLLNDLNKNIMIGHNNLRW